jgi:glycosyltransferase involved in cell wall biosynthesis
MRILLALTYYRPHVSGLTIYVERLAAGLARHGHEVTVLTSQHEPTLPREAGLDGVRVVRVPVAFRVGKGVVMPSHSRFASRLLRRHDVLSVHVPQLEASSLTLLARLLRRPAVLTYHCDLQLPPGAMNRLLEQVVVGSNAVAAALATRIVAYTDDYAASVPLLRRHREKLEIVSPPVSMPPADGKGVAAFRRRHGLVRSDDTHRPTVGMAARFAAEKGVDVLVRALPYVEREFPDVQVLYAGAHQKIRGEERYRARLAPLIEALGRRWRFVGELDPVQEMPAFLAALDCLVVPSVNSTESFGLVQVEAMLSGTPVVATALPGVRTVVGSAGMGELVPPRDAASLGRAICRVLRSPERYVRPREEIARSYDADATIRGYEDLFAAELRACGRRRRPQHSRA